MYNLYSGYLKNTADVLVYQATQPIGTVERYFVVIPPNAVQEPRFFHSLLKVWNIARNSGVKVEFYGDDASIRMIQKIRKKFNIEAAFFVFTNWNDLPKIFEKMKDNDALILFMSTRSMVSYLPQMRDVPDLLNKFCRERNFLLIFPGSKDQKEYKKEIRNISNADDFIEIGQIVRQLFK